MDWYHEFRKHLFHLNDKSFEDHALALFHRQAQDNPVYKQFIELVGTNTTNVQGIRDIPFLPVDLFKTNDVYLRSFAEPEEIFYSSSTTGQQASRHLIRDLGLYEKSCLDTFGLFYGNPSDYCILGLLPSYLEQGNSSLVYMAELFIRQSNHPQSGFYLYDYSALSRTLQSLREEGQPILLLGVSFALWELAELYPMDLSGEIIMETGGMKGRRRELIRHELHQILKDAFNVECIHSEYGMTELLSQAYAKGEGLFQSPPWMKVLTYDPYDPLSVNHRAFSGGINIIDLANIYSCSFLQTSDLGRKYSNDTFEVLGRFDKSDVRGCNLLV